MEKQPQTSRYFWPSIYNKEPYFPLSGIITVKLRCTHLVTIKPLHWVKCSRINIVSVVEKQDEKLYKLHKMKGCTNTHTHTTNTATWYMCIHVVYMYKPWAWKKQKVLQMNALVRPQCRRMWERSLGE